MSPPALCDAAVDCGGCLCLWLCCVVVLVAAAVAPASAPASVAVVVCTDGGVPSAQPPPWSSVAAVHGSRAEEPGAQGQAAWPELQRCGQCWEWAPEPSGVQWRSRFYCLQCSEGWGEQQRQPAGDAQAPGRAAITPAKEVGGPASRIGPRAWTRRVSSVEGWARAATLVGIGAVCAAVASDLRWFRFAPNQKATGTAAPFSVL